MKMICILAFFIFTGCSFLEPSLLIVKNLSDYRIEITADNGNLKNFTLEKGKGEFVMVPPGNLNLSVFVEEIRFNKVYSLKLEYLEKKRFDFDIGK